MLLVTFLLVSLLPGSLCLWSSIIVDTINTRGATRLYLNRIFVEEDEIRPDSTVFLDKDDYRFQHISKILKLEEGDVLRVGVVNVGMTDTARMISCNKSNMTMSLGNPSTLAVARKPPSVDMLLAVPRPLRLERLLPVVSCMGVNRLVLVDAAKVEKDYFGSHLFRRPAEVRKCFVEGLSQAESDYVLPEMLVRRRLQNFIENGELDDLFPSQTHMRIIAHPDKANRRISSLSPSLPTQTKVLLAIGPEGGWENAEIDLFLSKGFVPVTLGDRILRTDMAVPALIALAREWADVHS
jgi:RsmE family RNA methyltransferase